MDKAPTLLSHIPALQCPCDLDLLVFFARHPRTLMSGEQLARLLGYQPKEVTRSLDVLLTASFLTRAQNQARPVRPARMYVLSIDAVTGGPLAAIVELASTCEGRLALRLALTPGQIRTGEGLVDGRP